MLVHAPQSWAFSSICAGLGVISKVSPPSGTETRFWEGTRPSSTPIISMPRSSPRSMLRLCTSMIAQVFSVRTIRSPAAAYSSIIRG